MKIAISTDSTSDLNEDLIKKYNISIIPYTVILGEESKIDGTFDNNEIFEFVKQTKILPKTSAINQFQFEEYFRPLSETHDAVIHFSLSGEITSACSNAELASKNFNNVYVINSKSLSTGVALLVIAAAKLAEKGYDAEKIVSVIEKRIPFVQASFVIERLDYLYKGGRCSGLQLLGANLLKLRPQILLVDGKMIVGKKYRGQMASVIEKYSSDVISEFNNPDKDLAFITYTTATPEMIEAAEKALSEAGFREIICTTAGSTITSHCGEHTLGILYMNDGEQNF